MDMSSAPLRLSTKPPRPHHDHDPQAHLLHIPLELRLQIYGHLFCLAPTLTLRSLFIRAHYVNTFMTQQPKHLGPAALRVCRQVYREAIPVLYGLPMWRCACRVEALAVQIGAVGFAAIKRMGVDVDDLEGILAWCMRAGASGAAGLGFDAGIGAIGSGVRIAPMGTRLNFGCLEVLEVDGFQASALSARHGKHRARVEALRLCELAKSILEFHPLLAVLLQKGPKGNGGADARDYSLGRVRWRFVKDLPVHLLEQGREEDADGDLEGVDAGSGDTAGLVQRDGQSRVPDPESEHIVDLALLKSTLEFMLTAEENVIESSLPVAWTSTGTGRFNLYPYLQAA